LNVGKIVALWQALVSVVAYVACQCAANGLAKFLKNVKDRDIFLNSNILLLSMISLSSCLSAFFSMNANGCVYSLLLYRLIGRLTTIVDILLLPFYYFYFTPKEKSC